MKWIKTGRTESENGETTVYYKSSVGRFEIESRKRAIPHANGVGHWMHTSYFLTDTKDGSQKEYYALRDAKAAAEEKLSTR